MAAGKRIGSALGAVLASAALAGILASAAAAQTLAGPVRSVFLGEYQKQLYPMNQGDILVFENDDPFLSHGVAGPGFSAPVLPPRSTSLVRRASFLGAGSFVFADPLSPGTRSTLMVANSGAPLPPDSTRPSSPLRIVSKGRQVRKSGKLKVRAAPREPADVAITAQAGKRKLGTAVRAFPLPAAGAVKLIFDRRLVARASSIQLSAIVTDVAGNRTKLRKTLRL